MNYYIINNTLDQKIVGKYPQVEKAEYACNVGDPRFVDNVSFKKTNVDSIVAKAHLVNRAIVTDLISADILGFHLKKLISGKLKLIFQELEQNGLQFYHSPLIHKNIKLEDYWILNPYEFDYQYLDFSKVEVFLMRNTSKIVEKLSVKSFKEFEIETNRIEKLGYPYSIRVESLHFLSNTAKEFLVLRNVSGGTKYLASENLKLKIELEDCTGIEFQPSYLSLNEWLRTGGEREKIYGKV